MSPVLEGRFCGLGEADLGLGIGQVGGEPDLAPLRAADGLEQPGPRQVPPVRLLDEDCLEGGYLHTGPQHVVLGGHAVAPARLDILQVGLGGIQGHFLDLDQVFGQGRVVVGRGHLVDGLLHGPADPLVAQIAEQAGRPHVCPGLAARVDRLGDPNAIEVVVEVADLELGHAQVDRRDLVQARVAGFQAQPRQYLGAGLDDPAPGLLLLLERRLKHGVVAQCQPDGVLQRQFARQPGTLEVPGALLPALVGPDAPLAQVPVVSGARRRRASRNGQDARRQHDHDRDGRPAGRWTVVLCCRHGRPPLATWHIVDPAHRRLSDAVMRPATPRNEGP